MLWNPKYRKKMYPLGEYLPLKISEALFLLSPGMFLSLHRAAVSAKHKMKQISFIYFILYFKQNNKEWNIKSINDCFMFLPFASAVCPFEDKYPDPTTVMTTFMIGLICTFPLLPMWKDPVTNNNIKLISYCIIT